MDEARCRPFHSGTHHHHTCYASRRRRRRVLLAGPDRARTRRTHFQHRIARLRDPCLHAGVWHSREGICDPRILWGIETQGLQMAEPAITINTDGSIKQHGDCTLDEAMLMREDRVETQAI